MLLEEVFHFQYKLLDLETPVSLYKMILIPSQQDLEITPILISGPTEVDLSAGLGELEEPTELSSDHSTLSLPLHHSPLDSPSTLSLEFPLGNLSLEEL